MRFIEDPVIGLRPKAEKKPKQPQAVFLSAA